MKHLERICTGIDTSEIRAVLDRWPQLWAGTPLPRKARAIQAGVSLANRASNAHRDVSALQLRWLRPPSWDFYPAEVSGIADWALPLVQVVAAAIGARQIGYVSLHRLKAGGMIEPHIDVDDHPSVGRFHLVITSNPQCICTSGGERAHMAPGEIWRFDHRVMHSVVNAGPDYRVHLVLNAVAA